MSLLLDALRRASAKRDDPLAERLEVGRNAPAAEEKPAGPSASGADSESRAPRMDTARDGDDLSLVPEADLPSSSESQSDESPPPTESVSAGRAESSQRERAATQALLQAGAGQRRRRGASLLGLTLGVLVVSTALAGGGWLWYMQSQDEVASALGGYRPNPGEVELAANTAADSSASAPESGNPASPSQPAQPEQASSTADAQPADTDPAQETAPGGSDGTSGADGDDSPATVESTDTDTSPAEPEDQIAQAAAQLAAEGPASDRAAQSSSSAEPNRGTVSGGGDASTASTNSEPADAGGASGAASSKSGEARNLVERNADADPQRQTTRSAAAQPPRPMIKQAEGAPLVEALNTGYRALRAGDLAAAEQSYARARRLAPDNRDALLGTAAVRQRQGATDAARRMYLQVLDAFPRDPHAQAALAALDASSPRRNESTLKMLLRENPNAPALHYALGNVYAAEARWSEARLAYASAAQSAPEDPDYAYNLAVALDHLGRRDAARRAYAQALDLASGAAAEFDPAAVRRRLQQLR